MLTGGGGGGGANKGSSARIREKVAAYLAALRGGNDLLLDSSFGARCDNGELKEIRQVVLNRVSNSMALETRLREAGARVMQLKVTFALECKGTGHCMAFDTVFCFLFSVLCICQVENMGSEPRRHKTNNR